MEKNGLIWGDLLHFGYNMWHNTPIERAFNIPPNRSATYLENTSVADHLRCDADSWRAVTDHAADKGLNMIMIDVGEGLIYPSHPELAVKGSWDVDRFRAELARLRARGLEPIPKLNFSACHDTWLGEYERMVSTPTYYKVCADLIRDVAEVFDHPRFLHIGYDEEDFGNQRMNELAIVRNGELWRETRFADVCVLLSDGTMITLTNAELDLDDLKAASPWQVWAFGPELLDDEGKALTSFNSIVLPNNPRAAIGYYEPGHYCFVEVEGTRTGYYSGSRGMKMFELANLFESLGCKSAYNLDGGQSVGFAWMGELISFPYNRSIPDMIYVADFLPEAETEGEG